MARAGAALAVASLAFAGLVWDLPLLKLCAAGAGIVLSAVSLTCSCLVPRLARRVDLSALPAETRDSSERW